MPKILGVILVCIFIGVGIFSFSKAVFLSQINASLTEEINNKYKPKIDKLEKDNVRITTDLASTKNSLAVLEDENNQIKKTLRAKDSHLKQLEIAFKRKDKNLAEVINKHTELENENNLLKEKISAMFLEFTEMRKAFFSVDKLQERIKYLKSSLKKKEKNVKNTKQPDKDAASQAEIDKEGNRGYLVRDGKSTYVPKPKIRVTPVEG